MVQLRSIQTTARFAIGAAALLALDGCTEARPRAPLSDGERLYLVRCTGCHAAYEPGERTPEEWTGAVAKMERWKKVTLSDEDRALILGYLSGVAAGTTGAAAAPGSGTR